MSEKEAGSVLTSENAADFYANRLGLADREVAEAVVEETPTEPVAETDQSEPAAEDDAKKLGMPVDKQVGASEERPLMETKLGPSKASYTIHHPDKVIDIGSVRTPEKERGKGHASKMMQYLHEKADEMGYDTKLLASPLDKKTKLEQLVKFYKKHGYELTGEKGNQAGEPEMIRKHKKLTKQ